MESASLSMLKLLGWQPMPCGVSAEHRLSIHKDAVSIYGNTWRELSWKARVAQQVNGRTFLLASEYRWLFGHEPGGDDLQRVCCRDAGRVGHWFCGVCLQHAAPRFMCGCVAQKGEKPVAEPNDETWPSEFLTCKHVAAGAPFVGVMLLEHGEKSEGVEGITRGVLWARFCAECETALREVVRGEPFGAVPAVGR